MSQKFKRALLSVSDKSRLDVLAKYLVEQNYELLASGGTGTFLKDNNIPYTKVESLTGKAEAFDGRMKTLSFEIMSSILFDRTSDKHLLEAKDLNLIPIDVVVCNFYPFEEMAEKNLESDQLIDYIDVGGPTMVRAAAKNFKSVSVLTNIDQYEEFIQGDTLEFRKKWAISAFKLTADYDNAIFKEFGGKVDLRYGENPHQKSYLKLNNEPGIPRAEQLQGKQLSYNNILDSDAAWKLVSEIDNFHKEEERDLETVAIIKHNGPCGVSSSKNQLMALELAYNGDPVSAFGSIIAFSGKVDEASAKWLDDKYCEVVIAPSFSQEALHLFSKKKNRRVLALPAYENQKWNIRSIAGGVLYQEEDCGGDEEWDCVTKRPVDSQMLTTAKFGTLVGKYLKSNALALVQKEKDSYFLVGSGAGQPNRLECWTHLALPRALKNDSFDPSKCVLISDAFFPFADIVEFAAAAGIQVVLQPGGSIRDKEVIKRCNELNLSMVFTHKRHFKH